LLHDVYICKVASFRTASLAAAFDLPLLLFLSPFQSISCHSTNLASVHPHSVAYFTSSISSCHTLILSTWFQYISGHHVCSMNDIECRKGSCCDYPQHHMSLTLCSRAFWSLIIPQLVKYAAFCGTQRFITMLTTVYHLSLSEPDESSSHPDIIFTRNPF
jgi:hypothetical protein